MGSPLHNAKVELQAMLKAHLPELEGRVWRNRSIKPKVRRQFPFAVIFGRDVDIDTDHGDRKKKPRLSVVVGVAGSSDDPESTADDEAERLLEEVESLIDREFERGSPLADARSTRADFDTDETGDFPVSLAMLTMELRYIEPRPKPHPKELPPPRGVNIDVSARA